LATDPRKTLLGLIEALHELDEKRDLVLAEMRVICDGGDGIGERIRRCKVAFVSGWGELYKSQLVVPNNQQIIMSTNLKAFIVKVGEEETLHRIAFYFASSDAYYRQRRHPFELFVRDFNALIGLPFEAAPLADDAGEKLKAMRSV